MIRLDKMLAHLGYGTRKEVKNLIRKGNVEVNGQLCKDDDYKVNTDVDEVIINEESVHYDAYTYLILNKPQGVISATTDDSQQTVLDLLTDYPHHRLFPVGRLDKDTEGLLLITNDGPLAHSLLSPRHHVEKEYEVRLKNPLKTEDINSFNQGIILEDGDRCLPASLHIVSPFDARVILTEGKYHQIKRMFIQLGNEVVFLKRIRFGSIVLDDQLKIGMARSLTSEEVNALKQKK